VLTVSANLRSLGDAASPWLELPERDVLPPPHNLPFTLPSHGLPASYRLSKASRLSRMLRREPRLDVGARLNLNVRGWPDPLAAYAVLGKAEQLRSAPTRNPFNFAGRTPEECTVVWVSRQLAECRSPNAPRKRLGARVVQ
jgi:hypothetical protein